MRKYLQQGYVLETPKGCLICPVCGSELLLIANTFKTDDGEPMPDGTCSFSCQSEPENLDADGSRKWVESHTSMGWDNYMEVFKELTILLGKWRYQN